MIDEAAFWRRWAGPRRMYAVMETEICEALARDGRAMIELARDDAHVLVANAAAAAPVASGGEAGLSIRGAVRSPRGAAYWP